MTDILIAICLTLFFLAGIVALMLAAVTYMQNREKSFQEFSSRRWPKAEPPKSHVNCRCVLIKVEEDNE